MGRPSLAAARKWPASWMTTPDALRARALALGFWRYLQLLEVKHGQQQLGRVVAHSIPPENQAGSHDTKVLHRPAR